MKRKLSKGNRHRYLVKMATEVGFLASTAEFQIRPHQIENFFLSINTKEMTLWKKLG